MNNADNIKRLSRRLALASSALLWLTPVALAAYWIFFNDLTPLMKSQMPLPPGRTELPPLNRALCLLSACLPGLAALCGFATLRRLFRLYAAGEVFSRRNVACYRSLGRTLLSWALAVFVQTPLLSLAMSFDMPPGQRLLSVGLSSVEFLGVFAGLAALVISWVMDEARRLDEDQALTI